jgi:hypothetical protein
MRPARNMTIDIRFQAIAVYILILVWHILLWLVDRSGLQNLPIVLQGCFALLPLAATLLALFILESRIRHRQRGAWWVYAAVFVGLTPWLWYAYQSQLA